jgi:DnaJ-domain-containing protein 1
MWMRLLLIIIALAATATATWFGLHGRNSYSAHSRQELTLLEQELTRILSKGKDPEDHAFSLQLLRAEQERRTRFIGALGVAGLALLAAFLVPRGRSQPSLAAPREEEARLAQVMGDPAVALAGARHKAAALLGVAPDAPADAIEAALQERLAQYTPERLHGLAPEFMRQAAAQREALQRAAELLRRGP